MPRVFGTARNSREEKVETHCTRRERDAKELTGEDIEAETLVDEQVVEGAQTADYQSVEDGEKEKKPSEWIGECLDSLLLAELLFP